MKKYKLRIGYPTINSELREKHIFTGRTARQSTIVGLGKDGIKFLEGLFQKNLEDLYRILLWNVEHKIFLFRISSDIAPHITDPLFLKDPLDHKCLAYLPNSHIVRICAKIGKFAKNNGIRLTFHPGQYNILSSPDPCVIRKTFRDLYFQSIMLDLMGLDENSILILHGGGTYGDKASAAKRWIRNFFKLPPLVKRRIVLENDERSYSIVDVLKISEITKVPVVFDIFHHILYSGTNGVEIPLAKLFPKIISTWGKRTVKMHISEQAVGARFGSHADYVRVIPKDLLEFPKKYHRNLDLMIEAKAKEKAVAFLRKKYGRILS